MLMMPLARASWLGATSSAIIPYFTGPKNELTMAKHTSAISAPIAEPRANSIAVSTATISEIALRTMVMRDFE